MWAEWILEGNCSSLVACDAFVASEDDNQLQGDCDSSTSQVDFGYSCTPECVSGFEGTLSAACVVGAIPSEGVIRVSGTCIATEASNDDNNGVIIGAAVGGSIAFLLLAGAVVAYRKGQNDGNGEGRSLNTLAAANPTYQNAAPKKLQYEPTF